MDSIFEAKATMRRSMEGLFMIFCPQTRRLSAVFFSKSLCPLLIYFLISWSASAHNHDHHDDNSLRKHSAPQSQPHNCRGHLTQEPAALSPKDAWLKSREHLPKYLSLRWETVLDKLNIELNSRRNVESTARDEKAESHAHHAHARASQADHHQHEHTDSQNAVTTLILDLYPQAIVKAESMRKILFENSGSHQAQITSDQVYLKRIFATVWASLTVHTHEILTASKSKKTDFPRYFKILKSIIEFDENTPVFSLYKIKRAIEGRFSIQEYIDCL
ncbi:MAG: hypothetical protein IPK68_17295 [Bdellovibrionales bacterium]|nr:hypothetical protein [Bdellovibrionales bacterium]